MKNRRKAVQPFEIKKRKIDIFRNYEANGFEKNQRKFENFSTLISKKSIKNLRNIGEVLSLFPKTGSPPLVLEWELVILKKSFLHFLMMGVTSLSFRTMNTVMQSE